MTPRIDPDGFFVVAPRGQVGLTSGRSADVSRVTVQFGASGPFADYLDTSLRYATADDVRQAGLEGVNGHIHTVALRKRPAARRPLLTYGELKNEIIAGSLRRNRTRVRVVGRRPCDVPGVAIVAVQATLPIAGTFSTPNQLGELVNSLMIVWGEALGGGRFAWAEGIRFGEGDPSDMIRVMVVDAVFHVLTRRAKQ